MKKTKIFEPENEPEKKPKKEKRAGRWLIRSGVLLVLAAALLVCYNLWDASRAARASDAVVGDVAKGVQAAKETFETLSEIAQETEGKTFIPDYVLDPERDMPTEEIDGVAYVGLLEIPSLDLSLPVIEEWSYPHLKISPCRYVGTAYLPGFVIAAHNYERHFGHIKDLQAGDTVRFTDYAGNTFTYEVAATEILQPTAIEDMISDSWDLTLFTCTLGGRTRVSVRCIKLET